MTDKREPVSPEMALFTMQMVHKDNLMTISFAISFRDNWSMPLMPDWHTPSSYDNDNNYIRFA